MIETDVVERLRNHEQCVLLEGCENRKILMEAADEITRLRSQNATMREALRDMKFHIEQFETGRVRWIDTGLLYRVRAALASTEAAEEETK